MFKPSDFLVKPGARIRLARIDPDSDKGFKGGKKDAQEVLASLNRRLDDLQYLLYAEDKRSVLVVFQAMDTGGKDGVIRDVFEGVNPIGLHVVPFKVPSQEESEHDFLWRIHKAVPRRGELVVFNRSHYESVLVERVKGLVPRSVWSKRYDHINAFEKNLADAGTVIMKFYLHISKDEQHERLQARLDDPARRWKFNPGDLEERARWDEYMAAFEDALSRCSTPWAPWYVVPANKKWYRNIVVGTVIVETLEALRMRPPRPAFDASAIRIT